MNVLGKRTFPLHLHISTLVMLLVLISGATITYVSYSRTAVMLENASRDLFVRITHQTENEFDQLFTPGELATNLLALQRVTRATNLQQRLDSLVFMKTALDSSPEVLGFFVGYPNGDVFLMRSLFENADRKLLAVPDNAVYMVQSIEHIENSAHGQYIYYDKNLNTILQTERPAYAKQYDPRNLDWYKKALVSDHLIRTAPYVFPSDGTIGTTLARQSDISGVVAGAAIRLNSLATVLQRQKISKQAKLALVDPDGNVLADESVSKIVSILPNGSLQRIHLADLGVAPLAALSKKIMPDGHIPMSKRGQLLHADFLLNGEKWLGSWVRLDINSDRPMYLALVMPKSDMLVEANRMRRDNLISTLLILLLTLPIAFWLAQSVSRPLQRLAKDAEAVKKFDFSETSSGHTLIAEVNHLKNAMDSMRQTIRQFLQINQAVAAEEDFDVLMLKLLTETTTATDAIAGVLYLATADGSRLKPTASQSSNTSRLLKDAKDLPIEDLPTLLTACIASQASQTGKISRNEFVALNLPDMRMDPSEQCAMAVPLLNRKRQLVGALLLLANEQADLAKLSFLTALAASSAVSLETRELIRDQKELFESFIRMIAGAIDAKSPYTGGHCARVPELTKMLARAACDASEGPFADFTLQHDDWEAVHIAAWLHDCGKVTTPEFVVDKATKLETIYDRIHEIRLRFELLKKDAETDYWKSIAHGGDEIALQQKLESERATLNDEFAFVAQCNQGSEFFSPEKQLRLQEIGGRTWLRTIDDRLGIAHEAFKLLENTPASALPCLEPLISDRPEHRIARPDNQRSNTNNPWGFRMHVPELLYNRGELHNLSISKGTLTAEERYKINEHIIQTIIMLSQLPFPKHLQEVPEIAGGHHEKMDGTGYPKRLTREQMSPVARMMAIADIFEALTAVDRPYKKGKTLSEAINIMVFMKRDHHIDDELFELFLRSGVYMEYARRYMPEHLIDAVDIEAILAQ